MLTTSSLLPPLFRPMVCIIELHASETFDVSFGREGTGKQFGGVLAILDLLGRGDEVFGQLGRDVVVLQFEFDEVEGEAEFINVQHAVQVDIRQLPNLAQNGVRQLRLHHLFPSHHACDLAVDGVEGLKDLFILALVPVHNPLRVVLALLNTFSAVDGERGADVVVEGSSSDDGHVPDHLLVSGNEVHEARHVVLQHRLHSLQ